MEERKEREKRKRKRNEKQKRKEEKRDGEPKFKSYLKFEVLPRDIMDIISPLT